MIIGTVAILHLAFALKKYSSGTTFVALSYKQDVYDAVVSKLW